MAYKLKSETTVSYVLGFFLRRELDVEVFPSKTSYFSHVMEEITICINLRRNSDLLQMFFFLVKCIV